MTRHNQIEALLEQHNSLLPGHAGPHGGRSKAFVRGLRLADTRQRWQTTELRTSTCS